MMTDEVLEEGQECLLSLLWLIVAKFEVLWRSMCASSRACGGGSRA